MELYVEEQPRGLPVPTMNAWLQCREWERLGRPDELELLEPVARQPVAAWFTAGSPPEVRAAVAETVAGADGALPVLVAYNLPLRDCTQYSAGGADGSDAYRRWIDAFAAGIGTAEAIVILEPDGLALLPSEPWCPHRSDPELTVQRYLLVNHAVDALSALPRARTYLDAGHSAWQPIQDYVDTNGDDQAGMAARLIRAGVSRATGFFLNASNYQWTADQLGYGAELAGRIERLTAGRPSFVVDTSRNGCGPADPADPLHWCNPAGRGLGPRPTLDTGVPGVDAYLWIKRPGESDGECRGGPAAGAWWAAQALELARLANPPL